MIGHPIHTQNDFNVFKWKNIEIGEIRAVTDRNDLVWFELGY
jgi:hypothetical protein